MPEHKKTSQAVIDETREAMQAARLAIRRSRRMLAELKERSELRTYDQRSTDGVHAAARDQ
jgi:hypothetical protein